MNAEKKEGGEEQGKERAKAGAKQASLL